MLTREQLLTKWFKEWSTLRAWKRDLFEVEVEISDKEFPCRLGTCWSHEQRLVIYRGNDIAGELDTLLHELAHAATIGEAHGPAWQEIYAAAILEVTRTPIPTAANNYRILCAAGKAAMRAWWERSGNAFAVKLLGFR
jgi:hypothetical protein